MQRHWGFVFSVAKNSLSDSSLAEDATQQTFIALSKRAAKLSEKREEPRSPNRDREDHPSPSPPKN
jgi:DNA-directed RNA polymerase specialized sigma24 family protein